MNKLRGLHSNASLNSVKKKKSLKNKESSNSLSPNASSPIGAEGGVSELSEPGRLKFSWTRSEAIDCGLVCGQSATWGNTVYFKNGGTSDLYEYSYRTNIWIKLVACPYRGFHLTVINGLVTTIGGYDQKYLDRNNLLSLIDGEWCDHYPAMPTARHYPTATVAGEARYLVVAGGSVRSNIRISNVEVMDIEEKVWSVVSDLPRAISSCSSVACGDRLYVIGGFDGNGSPSNSVLTCSISALTQSPTSSLSGTKGGGGGEGSRHSEARDTYHHHGNNSNTSQQSPWMFLGDTPVTFTTCTSIHDNLIIVGGQKPSKRPTGDIHRYDPPSNTWELVGAVPSPRYASTVVILPIREIMVVGGLCGPLGTEHLNLLEVASF